MAEAVDVAMPGSLYGAGQLIQPSQQHGFEFTQGGLDRHECRADARHILRPQGIGQQVEGLYFVFAPAQKTGCALGSVYLLAGAGVVACIDGAAHICQVGTRLCHGQLEQGLPGGEVGVQGQYGVNMGHGDQGPAF